MIAFEIRRATDGQLTVKRITEAFTFPCFAPSPYHKVECVAVKRSGGYIEHIGFGGPISAAVLDDTFTPPKLVYGAISWIEERALVRHPDWPNFYQNDTGIFESRTGRAVILTGMVP